MTQSTSEQRLQRMMERVQTSTSAVVQDNGTHRPNYKYQLMQMDRHGRTDGQRDTGP